MTKRLEHSKCPVVLSLRPTLQSQELQHARIFCLVLKKKKKKYTDDHQIEIPRCIYYLLSKSLSLVIHSKTEFSACLSNSGTTLQR